MAPRDVAIWLEVICFSVQDMPVQVYVILSHSESVSLAKTLFVVVAEGDTVVVFAILSTCLFALAPACVPAESPCKRSWHPNPGAGQFKICLFSRSRSPTENMAVFSFFFVSPFPTIVLPRLSARSILWC